MAKRSVLHFENVNCKYASAHCSWYAQGAFNIFINGGNYNERNLWICAGISRRPE